MTRRYDGSVSAARSLYCVVSAPVTEGTLRLRIFLAQARVEGDMVAAGQVVASHVMKPSGWNGQKPLDLARVVIRSSSDLPMIEMESATAGTVVSTRAAKTMELCGATTATTVWWNWYGSMIYPCTGKEVRGCATVVWNNGLGDETSRVAVSDLGGQVVESPGLAATDLRTCWIDEDGQCVRFTK